MSKNLSQQVVLDRRGFVAATFATVAGLGLAGCSDTSAEADKGSAAGSSKSPEDTEASTTLDAKAFDKLVNNGPKADDDAIAASTWATAVKDAGVFKIGGVQTSTLFSLLNEKDGQTRGFDAGIAQLLSNYILGKNKVEITQVTSDTRESVLQNGQVDAVFATYTITDERKKLVSFAGPYYYATIVVLTTKDSQYANAASIADLAGGTCTSQSGTIWYDSCLPQIENTNLLAPADSAPAMIMQLQTGAVDYVCTDMPTALAAVAKDDNLVILNFSGTDGDFQFATEEERAENVNIGISVQKGNTQLADAIDTVLSVLNEEQFNALMDQAISIQPEI